MDDFRLKVFIAAARTLSFTRAAEQLYISQPAVSKHVGELESRYKVQLFTRRGSRLELTDAGRTMLEAAGRLLDDYRRLEYEMSLCADQTGGELRLGASTTIAQYLLPPILAHFTARFPGVRVSMSSGNSAEVEQALGEHAVDLGLVESLSRRQGLHYTLFRPDELVLVARPGGKYARRETVTPEELPRIPLVLRESGSGTLEVIAAALAARGIRLSQFDVTMRLGSTEGIKAFVRNSDAMAIVSVISVVDELRSGALRIVDIEGLTLSREFVFVHAEAEPAAHRSEQASYMPDKASVVAKFAGSSRQWHRPNPCRYIRKRWRVHFRESDRPEPDRQKQRRIPARSRPGFFHTAVRNRLLLSLFSLRLSADYTQNDEKNAPKDPPNCPR